MYKYPRTPHLLGSQRQPDDGAASRRLADLAGRQVVVTEKVDGANVGLWFRPDGQLVLQSRGHVLGGGPREAQFDRLKAWAHSEARRWWPLLGARRVVYGEWCAARHTMFYDALPHPFLAFDVWCRDRAMFLPRHQRSELFAQLGLSSVAERFVGPLPRRVDVHAWSQSSAYKSTRCAQAHLAACHGDVELARVGDSSPAAEGFVVRVESEAQVVERFKWVRPGFHQAIEDSGSHWSKRPLVFNRITQKS